MTTPPWVRGSLLLAVTFSAGIAVGANHERRRAPSHTIPESGASSVMHHVIHRMNEELHLDRDQQQAIAEILARRQGAVDSTWHALQPHVRATLDSTTRDIVAVLRPDQAAKYRAMLQRRH